MDFQLYIELDVYGATKITLAQKTIGVYDETKKRNNTIGVGDATKRYKHIYSYLDS